MNHIGPRGASASAGPALSSGGPGRRVINDSVPAPRTVLSRARSTDGRLPRLDPSILLLAAWALIALGAAVHFGVYTPVAICLVSAGVLLLSVAVLRLRTWRGSGALSRPALLLACLVSAVSTGLSPADRYARGTAAGWSHGLLFAAAVGLVALAWLAKPVRWLQYGVIALAGAAGVAGIRATPRPTIDDWHILQGSARALLHLQNSYGQAWPGSEGHLLPYLPGSVVFLTPFYSGLSDVRYGLLAALVLAAVAVAGLRHRADERAVAVLSGLVLVYPWVLYLPEQSWPEPLLLAFLAGMLWSVHTRRTVLAVLCFAAALATKQHVLILLPLAACWPAFGWRRTLSSLALAALAVLPWVIAGPRQFGRGAISYNLTLPPRHDSLSLFATAIRAGWTPSFALVPLLMLLVLALALWRLPRTAPGFVLGSAWLLAMFNLLNKQSFFNEWSLVIGLIILGLASWSVAAREPTGQRALPVAAGSPADPA